MNYEQLTSLFRVEERSVAFVIASLANILITIGATLVLVVALDKGPLGVIVGNFTGTLVVYLVLVGYRREQLGLQFDRRLFREMNRFGLPLVPTALFLWTTNFSDRLFLVKLADTTEVGLYSVGVRIASAMVLLLTAFRLAWPAFAYSIEDDREARRTYAYVLTYLVLVTTWVATGLTLLSPWIVEWLAAPSFADSSQVVGPLVFASVAFGGYIVVAIGVGRARRTQFNWVVTGAAAVVNIALNLILIPPYGMMGAAVATIAAYTTMFVGMSWWSQRIYHVPYQWRRVLTAGLAGVALAVAGKLVGGGLPVAAPALARLSARAPPARLLPPGGAEGDRSAPPSRAIVRSTRAFRLRRLIWRVRRSGPRIARPISRVLPDPGPPEKPVLIIGCPRSGTTLLLRALLQSGELRSVQSEGHILWDEFHHPRDRGWDSDALDAEDLSRREREYVYRAIRMWTPRTPLRRQDARKLPSDSLPRRPVRRRDLRLPAPPGGGQRELAHGGVARSSTVRQVPAPRGVHRARASVAAISGASRSCPAWRELLAAPLEEICARQYVASNETVLEARRHTDEARWIDVFYEGLVAHPVDEMRRLYALLDLPFTASVERFASAFAESISPTSVTAPRQDKWRDQYDEQIERIVPLVAATERRLGY